MKDYKKTSSNRTAVPQGKMVAKFAAGGAATTEPQKVSVQQAMKSYFKNPSVSPYARGRMNRNASPIGFIAYMQDLMKKGQLTFK